MHPVNVNACACGRPAVVNRSGKLLCRECAVKDAGLRLAAQEPDAEKDDPILARKREAEAAAFAVLAMEAGHRKARADWREQYADLLPVYTAAEEVADEEADDPRGQG